jgi:hypothetical protein
MNEIIRLLNTPTFNIIHTILFLLVLATPLFISRSNGTIVYYYTLFLLASWGINDGNCIINNSSKKDEYDIDNGLIIQMINNLGIPTSQLGVLLIRLIITLASVNVLYYYSSRSNYQKLFAWCIGWSLITVEAIRYIHIKQNGMKVYSFKTRLREFKKKWLS